MRVLECYFFRGLAVRFIIFIALFLFTLNLYSEEIEDKITISKLLVSKKNEPGCKRQGNIYGWCEWMLKFQLNNLSNKELQYFCAIFTLNKEKYNLCYGKNKIKPVLKRNDKKAILINLKSTMGYNNDQEKPKIVFLRIKPHY